MGTGAGLSGAIVVVRDLATSEAFYRELLDLEVEASSGEAVLLVASSGDRLALRGLSKAPHVSGGVGVRSLVWTAESAADLDRCEQVLRRHDAFVSRSAEDGWDVLDGRDPDGVKVILVFPFGEDSWRGSMPSRVYGY
jgi:catechol 2,3-dioxygenase-like lactoylglutathione lyase family enzyme